ncbi:MAG: AraC family transcriptional regulator [Myxococcota bacterium]
MGTWQCTHDHRAPGAEQADTHVLINVTLAGVYERHVGRHRVVADPTVAVVSRPGEAWRSSHPAGCGDGGVWVRIAPDRVPDVPPGPRTRRLAPPTWLAWAHAARDGDEELAMALVADVLGAAEAPAPAAPWVHRVQRILAAPAPPPDLGALAQEVGVSPWHLCRTFRAATGLTPRAYGEQLRLSRAAGRIAAGCDDLAELAVSLGFSSHSHLTSRFRAVFGTVPSALRTARS